MIRRSAGAMVAQNMSLAAAAIAFYMVWAFFPALAFIVVLAASLLDKAQVLAWLSSIRPDLPDSLNVIVTSQLDAIAERSRQLSIVTILSAFAVSMWGGMRGAHASMAALNLVYRERERRPFWHRQALALGLCLVGGAFVLSALALILGLAGIDLPLDSTAATRLLAPSRWPVLIVAMLLTLSIAYRYGPCRRAAKWRWVTWGGGGQRNDLGGGFVAARLLRRYTRLNPILGTLGSIVLFLFWCYLTVLTGLFGGLINAELERHTIEDTTATQSRGLVRTRPRRAHR